jgi:hypothetical protein
MSIYTFFRIKISITGTLKIQSLNYKIYKKKFQNKLFL